MGGRGFPTAAIQGPLYTYDRLAKPALPLCLYGEGWVPEFNTIGAVYPGACTPTALHSRAPLPFYCGQLYNPSPPPAPPFSPYGHSPFLHCPVPWPHHWPPPSALRQDSAASSVFYAPTCRPWNPGAAGYKRASRRTQSDVARRSRHVSHAKPESLTNSSPNKSRHLRRSSWTGGVAGRRGEDKKSNKNDCPKSPGLELLGEDGLLQPSEWQSTLLIKKHSNPLEQTVLAVKSKEYRAWGPGIADPNSFDSTQSTVVGAGLCTTHDFSANDELFNSALNLNGSEAGGKPLAEYRQDISGGLDVRPVKGGGCIRKKAGPSVALTRVLRTTLALAREGLDKGHSPELTKNGTGGAYIVSSGSGNPVAVFKPEDEEPCTSNNPRGLGATLSGEGLKKGVRPGEGAEREVAAYLLDHDHFSGVPPTMLVCCRSKNKNSDHNGLGEVNKVGSFQKFVTSDADCEEMGPAAFSEQEVHKICVLDMRLANADRNGSNILAHHLDEGGWELVPIDHGYCLPDTFEDICFEWKYWRQAKRPFGKETLKYISKLDAEEDIKTLEAHGISLREECRLVFRSCTSLLKKSAASGLTPYEISTIMCREAFEPSPLETLFNMALAVYNTAEFRARMAAETMSDEDWLMAAMDVQIDMFLAKKARERGSHLKVSF